MSIVHIAFYPSDWLAGTRGLSDSETGVYITLICRMYEMAAPIVRDDKRLSRLCGCKSTNSFREILNYLIEEGKIIEVDGKLFNERVEKEIEKVIGKSSKARSAANSRWSRKSNENNAGYNANASPEHTSSICQPEPEPEPDTTTLFNAREIEQKLREASGLENAVSPSLFDVSDPLNWLQSGCDLELDVLPTVRAKTHSGVRGWKYFREPVFEARDRRLAPSPEVVHHDFSQGRKISNQEKAVSELMEVAHELDANRSR